MNPDLQKYYEERFSTMSSIGWTDLIEDAQAMLVARDTLSGIETADKLHFRKGEVSILNWLISLKQVSEQAYEGLKNEGS